MCDSKPQSKVIEKASEPNPDEDHGDLVVRPCAAIVIPKTQKVHVVINGAGFSPVKTTELEVTVAK